MTLPFLLPDVSRSVFVETDQRPEVLDEILIAEFERVIYDRAGIFIHR